MVHCCVYRCPSKSVKDCGIHFFQFPYRRPKILPQWISAIRRKNFTPTKHHTVCSVHFTEDDYVSNHPGSRRKQLKACAVPTIFPTFPSYYQPREKRPRTSVTSSGKRTSSIATPSKCISPSSIATPSKCINPNVEKLETVEKDTGKAHVSGQRKLLKKISATSSGNNRSSSVSTGSDRIRQKVEQFETVEEDSRLSETDQTYVSRRKLLKEISEASTGSDSVSPEVEPFETVEDDSRLSETDSNDPLNILRQPKLPKNSGSRPASSSIRAENRLISPKVEIIYELVEHATVLSEDKATQTDEKRPAPPRAESQEKHLIQKLKTLQQKIRSQEVEMGNLKLLVAPVKKKKPSYLKNGKPVIVILP